LFKGLAKTSEIRRAI